MKINKKQLVFIAVFLAFITVGNSQSYMVVSGGNITVEGNLVLEDTNLINDGTFTSTGSTLINGSMDTSISGTSESNFNNLIIDKTSSNLLLDNTITVANNLDLTNGKILIQDNNLIFEAAATVSNYNASNYLVTEGLGKVAKVNLSASFEFPVGFNQTSYNPISITQNGDIDIITVRCLENVLEQGSTGNAFTTGVADVSWEVDEFTPGGSNLDIVAQWNLSDELSGFDRTNSGLSFRDATCWNMNTTDMGNALGTDPYQQFRTGVANTGVFAVGNQNLLTVLVQPIVFLEGAAINPNIGEELLMRDDLRVAGLIPTTSPYADALICDASVFNITGADAIVDWVQIELRDANDVTLVTESRSALLQRDGDVVDVDGTSFVKFTSLASTYYVAINHRNHLGVATATSSLIAGETITDLSSNTADVNGGALAITLLANGSYAIYGGDFNANGQVQTTDVSGVTSVLGTAGYNNADLNMNGQVQTTDINNLIYPNIGKGEQQ